MFQYVSISEGSIRGAMMADVPPRVLYGVAKWMVSSLVDREVGGKAEEVVS